MNYKNNVYDFKESMKILFEGLVLIFIFDIMG